MSQIAVELVDRDDVLVRRDLEHAVGRRVDDRRAGAHVLRPERVDDRRAGRDDVAERLPADAPLEFRDDVAPEIRAETWETALSRTMPAISQ